MLIKSIIIATAAFATIISFACCKISSDISKEEEKKQNKREGE